MFRPSSLASRKSSEEGSEDWEGGGWIGNVRYACTRTRTRTTGRKVKPPSKYVAMKAIETPITPGATLCSAKVLSSLFTTFGWKGASCPVRILRDLMSVLLTSHAGENLAPV